MNETIWNLLFAQCYAHVFIFLSRLQWLQNNEKIYTQISEEQKRVASRVKNYDYPDGTEQKTAKLEKTKAILSIFHQQISGIKQI